MATKPPSPLQFRNHILPYRTKDGGEDSITITGAVIAEQFVSRRIYRTNGLWAQCDHWQVYILPDKSVVLHSSFRIVCEDDSYFTEYRRYKTIGELQNTLWATAPNKKGPLADLRRQTFATPLIQRD